MTFAPILRWDNGVLKPVLVETSEGLKIAFDEELCDCECGDDEPALACACSCPHLNQMVITLSNGNDTCVYNYSTFNETGAYCIVGMEGEVLGCNIGDEEISTMSVYCYKEEGEDRWVLEMVGMYGYYYMDIPIDADGCPLPGDYTVHMAAVGDVNVNVAFPA